jgi:hypothetical protein
MEYENIVNNAERNDDKQEPDHGPPDAQAERGRAADPHRAEWSATHKALKSESDGMPVTRYALAESRNTKPMPIHSATAAVPSAYRRNRPASGVSGCASADGNFPLEGKGVIGLVLKLLDVKARCRSCQSRST